MIENPVLHHALPGEVDLDVTYGWASGVAFVAATDICFPVVQVLNMGVFLVSKLDTARCVIPGCVIAGPLTAAILCYALARTGHSVLHVKHQREIWDKLQTNAIQRCC